MTSRQPFARVAVWTIAGLIAVLGVVLAFLPASWIAAAVDRQTGGNLNLIGVQGTLWNGSAVVATMTHDVDAHASTAAPLLPGRFNWSLSPLIMLGKLDLTLTNPQALPQALQVRGNWQSWQVSPSQIDLPAQMLVAIGAPLNTIQPSGAMQLSWGALQLKRRDQQMDVQGPMTLKLERMASQLSPIKPLGSYQVSLDWVGSIANMTLTTLRGPLQLQGGGQLKNGRLQFSGQASADAGQEEKLANLINLLGQRQGGDQHVVVLEFK